MMLKAHHGIIASRNQMVKGPTTIDDLSKGDNMLGCEMKTAVIMYSLRSLNNHGIYNYCDTGTKATQPRADAKLLPFLCSARYPIRLP
ncbi:hypothetical protein BDV35DRAFT_354159 [Aspergillus flavus]|uniref:Uncharacterized protein n=1 Tax=Aspergillus flavus TaxID=5059 RepID=A0A5N6GY09_ASPFL|nr:hypothetical protein BDV35DRAFT_354159 [Aspergillus flavus]